MIIVSIKRFFPRFFKLTALFFLVVFSFSACMGAPAASAPKESSLHATDLPPRLKSKTVERIHLQIVTHEFPPFSYTREDGTIGGSTSEMVQAIMDEQNIPYSIQSYPWARALDMAFNEKRTLIYPITYTEERAPRFKWIYQLAMGQVNIYALATRSDLHIESLEDLRSHRTGIIEGYYDGEYLKSMGLKVGTQLDVSTNPQVWLEKFFNHRFDFLIGEENYLNNILPRYGYNPADMKLILRVEELKRPLCIAASPDMPDEINDMLRRKFIEQFGEDNPPWEN